MVRIPHGGCGFRPIFCYCCFDASMNWLTYTPMVLNLMGRDCVASCENLIPVYVE